MKLLLTAAGQRTGRNALLNLTSEVIGRFASFALLLAAARTLGESAFGLYNYGLALGFVVAQTADFGLQLLLAREVAVHGRAARPLVAAALRLKLLLSLLVLLLLVAFSAGWSGSVRLALLALGLMMLFQTYLEFAAYIFRGQQMLLVEARMLAAARLLMAVLGGFVLLLGGGLTALAISNLAAVLILALWSLQRLRRAGWLDGFSVLLYGDRAARHLMLRLLRQAFPLGVAIFLSIAYTRTAVLLLQARAGPLLVAHFSAAHRLVEPSQILPASLLAAVFPVYADALNRDLAGARRLGTGVTLLLAALGLVAALGFWFLAPAIVPLLYGPAYAAAVPVLQILGFSIAPAFVNYALTHYLIARRQQRIIATFTSVVLALHIALSWVLIPRLGAAGPAVSIIVAEFFLLICCLGALTLAAPAPAYATPSVAPDPDPARSTSAI